MIASKAPLFVKKLLFGFAFAVKVILLDIVVVIRQCFYGSYLSIPANARTNVKKLECLIYRDHKKSSTMARPAGGQGYLRATIGTPNKGGRVDANARHVDCSAFQCTFYKSYRKAEEAPCFWEIPKACLNTKKNKLL